MQSKKKTNKMMKGLAEAAVQFSKDNFGVILDYSEESIKLVEAVLDNLFESIPKHRNNPEAGPSDNQIQSVALMMGAYIGEVIKKKWGARWYMKRIDTEDIHTLEVMQYETFPVNKAYKRLTNGPTDNVWHYYNALIQSASPTTSGFI